MSKKQSMAGVVLALLVPVVVWSADVTVPFTFQSGTPIRASEMNGNFDALKVELRAVGATRSGTRLKPIAYQSSDGYSQPVGLWDDMLKTPCSVTGPKRFCVPQNVQFAFTDSLCNMNSIVAVVALNDVPFGLGQADAGTQYYRVQSWLDGGYTLYPLVNARLATMPLYVPGDVGSCFPWAGANGLPTLIADVPMTPSTVGVASLSVSIQ